MLAKFGGGIYRARWAVLLVSLLAVAGAAVYGFGVFGALKSGGFEDPNSESARAQTALTTHLSNATTDIVILLQSDGFSATNPAFAQAANGLLDTLAARPEVASLTSYYSTKSPSFLSRDGHETFALVRLAPPPGGATRDDELAALKPLMTAPPLQVTLGGNLLVNQQINGQVGSDLARAESLTFPILAVLLVLVFGGLVAAGLPLLVGGLAILLTFALVRGLAGATDVTVFVTNVVTFMGLGLAIDYSLFIITRFREELAPDDRDVRGALARTMASAGRTVLFSGLTVSVSLLGLLLFPEFFLRSMGLGASAAVLAAMLVSLTILPALLALLGRRVNALSLRRLFRQGRARPAGGAAAETRGAWYRLSQTVMRFPVPVLLGVLAVLLLLGSPFLHAAFSTPDARVLPPGASARAVSDRLAADLVTISKTGKRW